MFYRILTKNGIENTNIDGARNYNFNAGRRSGIVKGALNQGNFFASSSGSNVGHTVILDTCELRLCGHRVVIDEATYWSFHDLPQTPQRYSLIAQVIVDNSENVTFDLFLQSVDTPLIQDNLDKTGTGTYQLEIGRYTQQTDGTITDVVRTADLITGGVGDDDAGEVINIGNVKTNTLDAGMEAEVDIENRYSEEEKKTYTDFTFSIPKGGQGIQGVQGEKGETGATGNGIISISKTGTSKLVDTYTISFTSGATTTFQVTNGKGITKIEKTATSGLVDTYTITFNDTTTSTFQVTNGAKGDKGDKGDTGVTPNITATATTLPAGSSATVTKSGTAENPAFAFGIPKGDKGDKGEKGDKGDTGVTPNITATATTLPAGSSATVTKSGTAENPAFAFGIPKGDKGDKGEKGDKGDTPVDVEHVETIYDMSSSDSNINWGNTAGIPLYNELNIVHDFSGFKKYDFIYEPNTRSDNWYCSARTITVYDAIAGDWVFTYFDCVSPSGCYAQNLGGVQIYTQFRMANDKQSVSVISSIISANGDFSNIASGYGNFYRLMKIVGYK